MSREYLELEAWELDALKRYAQAQNRPLGDLISARIALRWVQDCMQHQSQCRLIRCAEAWSRAERTLPVEQRLYALFAD